MKKMNEDPYNYRSLNRKDLMSLSTIKPGTDNQKITKKDFITARTETKNLYTKDIEGNAYCLLMVIHRFPTKAIWIKSC